MAEGYFWITLAATFDDVSSADAGPFTDLNAAVRRGSDLASAAGQSTYTMAEFDGAGNQITAAAAWVALDAAPGGGEADSSAADAAATQADASRATPGDVIDSVTDIYGQSPAISDAIGKTPSPSRWARKRRRKAERSSSGPRPRMGRRTPGRARP